MQDRFPPIRFKGQLRPSQIDVVEIARRKLSEGRRRLHVVAPPGSGKTVLGLYLWAECIRMPALVLSPNSAIQAQWCARLDLFDCPGGPAPLAASRTALATAGRAQGRQNHRPRPNERSKNCHCQSPILPR